MMYNFTMMMKPPNYCFPGSLKNALCSPTAADARVCRPTPLLPARPQQRFGLEELGTGIAEAHALGKNFRRSTDAA